MIKRFKNAYVVHQIRTNSIWLEIYEEDNNNNEGFEWAIFNISEVN